MLGNNQPPYLHLYLRIKQKKSKCQQFMATDIPIQNTMQKSGWQVKDTVF